ncbi:cytochrome b/b6 domain-containing protein [Paraglaciecola aquimarina]|uniref:Cytochrome b/b6 domain-containing protein n=1 Tax=Paraglaciecola aquimarina TaxID=1235557 RepID=A0ABU3SSS2_9ALTE|nr:cytochrome b/b6 domain-containing protein [Paraglaciecola aquimarina]MDU0353066.1 cytochrome b/b6 domain-containing protein [Paraglaciecola aquimarina]
MQKRLVWDLPVRLFHWILAISLVVQWFTAEVIENAMDFHFYLGYFILGLIIFRLIWGFIGTKYAKFSSFIAGPKAMLAYLRALMNREDTSTIGHNPVGGLMLPLVLTLVGIQAVTGLFTSDDIVHSGPYYDSVSSSVQKTLQWLHHQTFSFLWIFVAIHIVAILWYKFALKHDLIRPMFNGKKVVTEQQAIANSQLLKAVILMVVVAVFVYWLVEINPPIPEDDFYY